MSNWREFAKEVPTEPRAVVTNDEAGDSPTLWVHDDNAAEWQEAGGNDEVEYDSGATEEQWREVAAGYEHTHWAYVEPPGVPSAKSIALPLPEPFARQLMEGAKAEAFVKDFEGGSMCVIMTARPEKLPTLVEANELWVQQLNALLEFGEQMAKIDALPAFAVAQGRGDG